MANEKKHARTFVKVILAIVIPLIVIAAAFCGAGLYMRYYEYDKILPTLTIDGTDVSWLTSAEAYKALDLQTYEARWKNTAVSVTFPDGSELRVTGDDIQITHDAQLLIDAAYSRGRGNGFVQDTWDFLSRVYRLYITRDAQAETFNVHYETDVEPLRARVNAFTESYNSSLEKSLPLIYEDRIVIVKGAGEVQASDSAVFDLVVEGLSESRQTGIPVEKSYALPDTSVDSAELTAIRRHLLTIPLSAQYDQETKEISDSVVGVDFDYIQAVDLLSGAEAGKTISIAIERTQPEVTREHLESILFHDIIGECVTKIGGSENRLNNIILASEAINGIVLEPGEEFSFNRVVGRRTTARGYKSAPAFSGGQTVQAIGGGICQVSSTIYSAIKDTDIRIKERHPHGQPITYLPRGRDATVSWGSLDFKFINNTLYPLRIDIELEDRTLTVRVVGTLADNEQIEVGA